MIYLTRTHKTILAAVILLSVIISGTLYIRQGNTTEIGLAEAIETEEAAASEPMEVKTEIEPEEISVYICGNVKNPGVVKVQEGTRLDEAIEMVGGAREEADLNAVNLAYRLADEDMVYIPEKGEKPQEAGKNIAGVSTIRNVAESNSGKVNINTASESELDTLEGIGPVTAKAIIQYRNQTGAFNSIEDIKKVKGIGDSKYNSIKDEIVVE